MCFIQYNFQDRYVKKYPEETPRYYTGDINWEEVQKIPDDDDDWNERTLTVFKTLMKRKYKLPSRSDEEWKELGVKIARLSRFGYYRRGEKISSEEVELALNHERVDEHLKPLIASLIRKIP
jgi:hypothetical protein